LLLCMFSPLFLIHFLLVFSSPSARPGIPLAESRRVTADCAAGCRHIRAWAIEHMLLVRVSAFWRRRAPVPKLTWIRCVCRYLRPSPSSWCYYEAVPSAACGSADGDAVGIRPRAPAVSAPPRAHTDTARAAGRVLVHSVKTEMLPTEHGSCCGQRKRMCGRCSFKGA
jgi:hypothetical protein